MTGYHPANFGLSRPFCSRVKWWHGTDRRTDGQTDTATQFIMPSVGAGHSIVIIAAAEKVILVSLVLVIATERSTDSLIDTLCRQRNQPI